MTIEKVKDLRPRLAGWCTEEKAEALYLSVIEEDLRQHNDGYGSPLRAVEIGVFGGQSLAAIAVACADLPEFKRTVGHVWGVDPWQPNDSTDGVQEPENVRWWSQLDHEAIYAGCLREFLDSDLTRVCTLLRMTSRQAAQLFNDSSLDLIHIDGNHSEVSSTQDVILWLPKLHTGGLLWFDDMDWPSTRLARELLNIQCNPVQSVGTCTLFRKI